MSTGSTRSSEDGDIGTLPSPSTYDMDRLVDNVNLKRFSLKPRYSRRLSNHRVSYLNPSNPSKPSGSSNLSPVPSQPQPPPPKSIDEIIRTHSPLLNVKTQAEKDADSLLPDKNPPTPPIKSINDIINQHYSSLSSRHVTYDDSESGGDSGIESDGDGDGDGNSDSETDSHKPTPIPTTPTPTPSLAPKSWIAQYLRQPQLTRLLKLRRHPHSGLQVSLCDLGDSRGNPVLIYLGLGCTRHLIALYADLASTLNLRLICVDRWGLGRTDASTSTQRGLLEWASVIEEVLDSLRIQRVALLAHSAGAPYALALAHAAPQRIALPITLLAPWVHTETHTSAGRWLRHVPKPLLRAAQVAEWTVAGWSIGKPPQVKYEGVEGGVGLSVGGGVSGTSDHNNNNNTNTNALDSGVERSHSHPTVPTVSKLAAHSTHSTHPSIRSYSANSVRRLRKVSLVNSSRSSSSSSSSGGSIRSSYNNNNESNKNGTHRPFNTLNVPTTPNAPNKPIANTLTHSEEKQVSVGSALLAASHAESHSGGGPAHDLLLILNRGAKPWGFDYRDISASVHVYWGDKDDRISEDAVQWMEENMTSCKLTKLPGKTHSLLTDPIVIADVLENLADKYSAR
ncbi:hypothetical protein E3P98_01891 [Wallemia ichthyophaga]|nr:hypothetical protein E3P98_01891 [Wallemia ichthyophaga]